MQEVLRKSEIGSYEPSLAGQLLQIARSTPMLISTLVGHKNEDHVRENLEVVKHTTLSAQSYDDLASQLADS